MSASRTPRRQNVPAARVLRGRETLAEQVLWEALRGRRLGGLKFRRQHPIGPFVADFCCPDRRLVVELDGGVHELQRERDAEREELLRAAGYSVLRFTNDVILADLARALRQIQGVAERLTPRDGYSLDRTAGW